MVKQVGQRKYEQFEVSSLRYQDNRRLKKAQQDYGETAMLLMRDENMKLKETVSVL